VRHRDGHAHYPKEDGKQVWEYGSEVSSGLDGCYTADLFTARMKKWITDQRAAYPQQPFMCYLAFDTPHAKIQYPPGPYPSGGGQTGGVQWLGTPGRMINTADGTPDGWCHPDYAHATWDDDRDAATPEKPWPDVDRRYASAVRRLDDCAGDVLHLLKDLGIENNTLVVFTSDNGVSMESYLDASWVPRLDDLTPFAQGTNTRPSVAVSARRGDVALLFTGLIEAPEDGEYRFHLTADTGAVLRIHEATVIDADATGNRKRTRLRGWTRPHGTGCARRRCGPTPRWGTNAPDRDARAAYDRPQYFWHAPHQRQDRYAHRAPVAEASARNRI
jgi:hypothetical protein